jgi:hypothetical protein
VVVLTESARAVCAVFWKHQSATKLTFNTASRIGARMKKVLDELAKEGVLKVMKVNDLRGLEYTDPTGLAHEIGKNIPANFISRYASFPVVEEVSCEKSI